MPEETIEEIKTKLIGKYGINPTITYYYYLWNVVDYCGEERVRQSFDSIKDQGVEVIIGDYSSTDRTKEIVKEYGFKYIRVKKDPSFNFAESKIRNKVIQKSKCNFLVPLNINVEYPKYMASLIRFWLLTNNITKKFLRIRYKYQEKNGDIERFYGFSSVFYKPFLKYARGYDERTSYGAGSQKYGSILMTDVYELTGRPINLRIIHKYHDDIKLPMLEKIYPNIIYEKRRRITKAIVETLINNLKEDFDKGIKQSP